MKLGEKREPALVLILSILTFGVYYLYWVYQASAETQEFLGEPDTSPGLEVALFLLTCGIYTLYWDYKMAQKIVKMQNRVGIRQTDNGVLYLVLDIVGFGIVNALIQQNQLNEVWNAIPEQRIPN
jgi:hypothetical protein